MFTLSATTLNYRIGLYQLITFRAGIETKFALPSLCLLWCPELRCQHHSAHHSPGWRRIVNRYCIRGFSRQLLIRARPGLPVPTLAIRCYPELAASWRRCASTTKYTEQILLFCNQSLSGLLLLLRQAPRNAPTALCIPGLPATTLPRLEAYVVDNQFAPLNCLKRWLQRTISRVIFDTRSTYRSACYSFPG